ncbi:ABC-2 transporter permease [Shouchella clausii]|uniref:ABC-2 transporter permease n=1 Tax=Shouchella clausii TaxID=79880 RepID=UPI0026F43C5D|nr:ABC-2 transporter permease [Shouchella clausii]MDO7284380.1 ABC-2 transporter permease [Shouchella clausii]MDO7304475.1 ABC-2 transporter permease [Shouchella clausii]
MKGLVLNQYYSVGKSFWNYIALSVVITAILLFTQNEMLMQFAAWLPLFFMVTPALEVLKHESMSGWSKFVLTLPLKRREVVQSHYLFYSMMIVIGIVITVALFMVADSLIGQVMTDSSVNKIMNGVGIVLISGLLNYPLTYLLGTEKSDGILVFSIMAAVGLFLLSSWLFEIFLGAVSFDALQGMNLDKLFSGSFLAVTFVLFMASYVIALQVYKRKEF